MQRKTVVRWSGLALLLAPVGCGKFKRPSTVAHSVYVDCNNGEYPKARRLFVEERREHSDGALDTAGEGIRQICDNLTHSGSVDSMKIRTEDVYGDRATVLTDLRFRDGSVKLADRIDLVQEDGAWKVAR